MSTKHHYDIVIIGSGVAGASCAWKLSQYGRYSILILEAGDNEITNGQRIEFHYAMDAQGNRGDMYAPYKDLESRFYAPAPENAQAELKDQRNDPSSYYDYTDRSQDAFKAGYNRMVGGSTWSWRGNCPRFLPSDFKLHSTYGVGRDWPLDYNELEPWYCQAEWELGVSGNHDEMDGLFGAHRSRPFPMTGIPLSHSDAVIKRSINGKTVEVAGEAPVSVRVVTTPQARNTAHYDGRPACEGHSNCIPLCPIQAKYDATTHLRRALEDKNVTLRKRAVVTHLEKNSEGAVTKVHFKDWHVEGGKDAFVTGRVVVLAAHAIESPKILLMSKLANRSDQVGRNLMDHIQFEVIAMAKAPLYPFRGPQSVTGIEDFREGSFRSKRSGFRMTIGNDGWGRAGSPASVIENILKDPTKFGSSLPAEITKAIPRMTRLSFSTEMLPNPENRVELSAKVDPELKIPRPLFTFDIGQYTKGGLLSGLAAATEIFKIMGAEMPPQKLLNPPTGPWAWNTAAHIMGTCIMGDDPDASVVDRWGRTHEVPNLWVVGSSVFPTSATANPTLTLAALSLRTAAAIHRQMLQGTLGT